MKCPECHARNPRTNGADYLEDGGYRRYRVCGSCGLSFTSVEHAVVFTGKEYKNRLNSPPPEARYRKLVLPSDHWGLPAELAQDVAHWWQVSRWSKQRSRAVWTFRAFESSLQRVQQLHAVDPARAKELVEQGVEKGWQTLDPKYLSSPMVQRNQAAAGSRTGPNSPAMQSALDRWHEPI